MLLRNACFIIDGGLKWTSDERLGIGQVAGSEGIVFRGDSMFKDYKAGNGWYFQIV